MAKIKYSALVSDMRNKLNGSVASKNRAGSYLRNKVTPVNPQTPFQQANRQRLGSMSSEWRGLTEQQRQSWLNATGAFPYTDIFGDRRELDGKSLFVKLNLNLLNSGSATIVNAPTPVGVPEIEITNLAFDQVDGVTFDINTATVPAGFALLVYATPPIDQGTNFIKNRLRLLGVGTATANEVDATTLYNARFSAPTVGDVGKNVFVRVALVSTTTGQLGVAVQASVAITP
jgi:hypothetical protein